MALEQRRDTKMSVQEFFELIESEPEFRYEYIDGYAYMMTGGKPRHAAIGSNVCRILGNLLRARPCTVYNSDVCVQLSDFEDEKRFICDPCLVVEALSPGTKSHDRGMKFSLYQDCPSLQEYLLIDTEAPKVQLYRREADKRWTISILRLEDMVDLTSLNVSFPVAEIYEKTRFARHKT